MNESNTTFFSTLEGFASFSAVTDPRLFIPAPDNWVVVIADVVDSTQAVRDGRYKDVNMVGASFLAATLNAVADCDIPYMFGGDGAVALVPRRFLQAVRSALIGARSLAAEQFELRARLGFVEVADLRARGVDVQVARFNLSSGNSLAMFAGGGTELAESLVSGDDGTQGYVVSDEEIGSAPDLTGLSCRWEPLRPRNGRIVCLLVKALSHDAQHRRDKFDQIIKKLTEIIDIDGEARPVNEHSMRFKWPPGGLEAEAKATRGASSYWRRYLEVLVESLIQAVMNRLDLKGGAFDARAYRDELRANSDYRRFDGTLRLVLDSRADQIRRVRTVLENDYQAGDIVYGLHETDAALMTCLVFSLERSEHIHFVDGDEGGFWSAAAAYKERIGQVTSSSTCQS
ncbi:MAG: DUF3095 domain-containing protein [Gammaproteobacteria bacterium]